MVLEVTNTADGSDTIFRGDLDQHYHSTFGALQESNHIFIENGLRFAVQKNRTGSGISLVTLNILEIGFGTGLNALLTCLETEKLDATIHYTSIEPVPLEEFLWRRLNYPQLYTDTGPAGIYQNLHLATWDIPVAISPRFTLFKVRKTLQEYIPGELKFDLVFFDAFGPDAQPELWTEQIFRKIACAMNQGGILVTYSVKGIVVRALQSAGFLIEKLPGPPGKRHILRAIKP